ncbi:hypothetical protein CMU59_16305 [Elizabethkingia anophelis]|uniref:GIY-YIG nuclease family protein n=1 Tax=Elizabethkingia anophelis TaxID=1117645 RepID=UPI002012D9C4|nr:GIY-YIG nuclease family protein [Elizabethkingia anophelis]MCL1689888.1 GIY-YIG nuclease family protein [Elizabethkingia anophelis]MCT4215549.1 GIY-YIG nuclease family protein [Elizabethkingia anophelis]MDV3574855.1 hypothetical protein [Elizabethkingia anophelis]MDV3599146.1 hypothetical protein [Elizabethkingia anophelis]MDV3608027.1 hypothetical protein [Elizabethkingia anophelis]
MRPKKALSILQNDDKNIDVEELKLYNPRLWKKLKSQFDTGRKIITVQINNGLDRINENTLREYLMEYANRFLNYGPKSFPTSFNTLEPFFKINYHNSILQLHSEEESYAVSLFDFLDFVTEKKFDLNAINYKDNIPENIIYHFSFTSGYEEINFSNNDKTFIIGAISMVRNGNEVSILMEAGESYDKKQADEYFKKYTKEFIERSMNPKKKALGLKLETDDNFKIVFFEDNPDLWLHNIGVLFDLEAKKIDIRFVARDQNISFNMFTDDFDAVFYSQENLNKDEFRKYYESLLENLSKYDAVFDFAKYCLALPFYVFENENKIVDVNYETKLNKIIKSPISKREFLAVPGEYKVFAKPLYYLESENVQVIKNIELNDESFKLEKSGYWKRLDFSEEGFDKKGNKILGKTWVERNDAYYSTKKGTTEVSQTEIYEGANAGYIYIMREPSHEINIFKIGLTRRSTEERRKELSNTSSPDKFLIVNSYNTKDCVMAEKLIHKELEKYRLTERREFFRCDLRMILDTCEKIINSINK